MDDVEFNAFYAASVHQLIGQLYVLTGSAAEAEDCVQEAFARGWSRRRQLDVVSDPTAWVRTVAWRLAISRWRRARNAMRAWQSRADVASRVAGPEPDRVVLEQALRQLPRAQRECVVLFHVCDLSVEQISEVTGAANGTVKARLSRGRTRLATLLSEPEYKIGASPAVRELEDYDA